MDSGEDLVIEEPVAVKKEGKELIFTRFFVVGIVDKSGSRGSRGHTSDPNDLNAMVLEKFPSSTFDESLERAIPAFCFPESDLTKLTESSSMFVFVLTDSLGVKQYAYCKRREPKRGHRKLYMECLCILSHHPWFSLFSTMLEHIEARRMANAAAVQSYLEATLMHPFPGPGDRFTVRVNFSQNIEGLPFMYPLERPNDTQLVQHHIDYSDLFQIFEEAKVIKIFASLLFERRILFIGSDLGKLSSVIHAAASLLTPFVWQHVFIPILPSRLIDYVLAPMPFVVGIHSSMMDTIAKLANSMDEVIFINLDDGTFLGHAKDYKLLPEPYLGRLKSSIRKHISQKNEIALFSSLDDAAIPNVTAPRRKFDQQTNSDISESFLRFLASIFGKFDEYFDANHQFQALDFRNAQPKNAQVFLEAFSVIQMYEQFINDRSKRRAQGLEIGFQTVVDTSSNLQRFVLSSKDVGKKLKSKAGKTLESVLASSKALTQKSYSIVKSGLEPAFKTDTLKLFSPSKSGHGIGIYSNRSRDDVSSESDHSLKPARTSKSSLDDPDVGSSPSVVATPPKDLQALHEEAGETLRHVDSIVKQLNLEEEGGLPQSRSFPSSLSDVAEDPGSNPDPTSSPTPRRNSDPPLSFTPVPNLYKSPPLQRIPRKPTAVPAVAAEPSPRSLSVSHPSSPPDPSVAPPRKRATASSFTTGSSSSSSSPSSSSTTKSASSFFSQFRPSSVAVFSTPNEGPSSPTLQKGNRGLSSTSLGEKGSSESGEKNGGSSSSGKKFSGAFFTDLIPGSLKSL